jgi:hypothetical protein
VADSIGMTEPQLALTKPRRRWYQYSLRTFLLVMTVEAVILGLLLYVLRDPFGDAYDKISVGTGIDEVEKRLGAGKELPANEVPRLQGMGKEVMSVTGDQFFEWTEGSREIWVGVKDGRVYSKWYWEPSL